MADRLLPSAVRDVEGNADECSRTVSVFNGPAPEIDLFADGGTRPLIARWRGSALAWPLIDARLMPGQDQMLLCALHRADSFIVLSPTSRETRTAVYRWNGFGFTAVTDASEADACRRLYADQTTHMDQDRK